MPIFGGTTRDFIQAEIDRVNAGLPPGKGWRRDYGGTRPGGSVNGFQAGPGLPGGLRPPIVSRFDPNKPGTGLPGLPGLPGIGGNGNGGFDPCALIWPSRTGTGYQACRAAQGILTPGGDGGGGKPPTVSPNQGETCPTGYNKVGGQCVSVSDILPGGQPFTVGAGGTAVVGSFNLPAITPTVVGFQQDKMGNVNPIRRCPTGMVLGKDDLCYPRQILSRRSRFRKWRSSKPKVSAGEWKTLQRAERTREKVKDVAKAAGWKVTKKGSRRSR